MKLYRAMKVAADGMPQVGTTSKVLGVRLGDNAPHNDVTAIAPSDPITPGSGGMSVAPNDPMNLPRHLRPAEFGGVGKEPVWEIDDTELPPELSFRRDHPSHGTVESTVEVTLDVYLKALESTRGRWQRLSGPNLGDQP